MSDNDDTVSEASTREAVAFDLFCRILRDVDVPPTAKDRLLSLYAECLLTVVDPWGRVEGRHKAKLSAYDDLLSS